MRTGALRIGHAQWRGRRGKEKTDKRWKKEKKEHKGKRFLAMATVFRFSVPFAKGTVLYLRALRPSFSVSPSLRQSARITSLERSSLRSCPVSRARGKVFYITLGLARERGHGSLLISALTSWTYISRRTLYAIPIRVRDNSTPCSNCSARALSPREFS